MKEKKQFRKLADEELKEVTGGGGFEPKCNPKTSYEGGICPSSYADKGNECCTGGFEKANHFETTLIFVN